MDCPRRITVGDPSYFEEFSGERLKRLTASYTSPGFFEARMLLTEVEFPDFLGEKVCGLSVYMASKETIETYAEGMMYGGAGGIDQRNRCGYGKVFDDCG